MSRDRLAAIDGVAVTSQPAHASPMGDRCRHPLGRIKVGLSRVRELAHIGPKWKASEVARSFSIVIVAIAAAGAAAGGCHSESEHAGPSAAERSVSGGYEDAAAATASEGRSADSAESVLARMRELRDIVCACKDAACADGAKKTFEERPTAPVRAAPQATREAAGEIIEGFADCYFTFKYGSGARGAP